MLDYIHSAETEQFSFLRVPKILLQNDTFKGISAEAKLLYSILFDRTELSNRNGWRDDQDRVYINKSLVLGNIFNGNEEIVP